MSQATGKQSFPQQLLNDNNKNTFIKLEKKNGQNDQMITFCKAVNEFDIACSSVAR